jgi:hypothetical protein
MTYEPGNDPNAAEPTMTNIVLNLLFVGGWVVFAGLVVADRNRVTTPTSKPGVPLTAGQTEPPPNEVVASPVDAALWTALDDRQLVRLLTESSP